MGRRPSTVVHAPLALILVPVLLGTAPAAGQPFPSAATAELALAAELKFGNTYCPPPAARPCAYVDIRGHTSGAISGTAFGAVFEAKWSTAVHPEYGPGMFGAGYSHGPYCAIGGVVSHAVTSANATAYIEAGEIEGRWSEPGEIPRAITAATLDITFSLPATPGGAFRPSYVGISVQVAGIGWIGVFSSSIAAGTFTKVPQEAYLDCNDTDTRTYAFDAWAAAVA